MKTTIGFIGGGNMASCLIGGLIDDGCKPDHIWVAEPDKEQCAQLASRFSVHTIEDNNALAASVDVVVLAVKPQLLAQVCKEIANTVQATRPLLISIAAGVLIKDIQGWLEGQMAIVRAMPNTPALVQSGATGLCASTEVTELQREQAEAILRAVGLTLWLEEESLMDAVTAVSGSGPAYFFLMMEAMESAGRKLGLEPEAARLLTLQTAFGAAKMALESPESTSTLRQRVTSPGGTTEQAIKSFETDDIRGLFERALTAARDRSQTLAQQLGEQD
jgi:pyrroline-5-carboxylate reductase